MALEPQYGSTPRVASVNVATANTNRDGTGTVATLITAGTNGTQIREIIYKARVTTTAGMLRIFLHDGSTFYFLDEISVLAATPSGTVQGHRASVTYANLVLPSGWSIRVSTNNAESADVTALGADL